MWTEAIRAIPVALTLIVNSPSQTPSTHLRPVQSLYERATEQGHVLGVTRDEPSARLWTWQDQRIHPSITTGVKVRSLQSVMPGLSVWTVKAVNEEDLKLPGQSEQSRIIDSSDEIAVALPEHARAVQWLIDSAGLTAPRLAEMLGVSRVRIQGWKTGAPIMPARLERVLQVRDVLTRAMSTRPLKEDLAAWLATPDPYQGVTPAQLLQQGDFDRARMLTVVSPSRTEPLPDWARRPIPAKWQRQMSPRQQPDEFFDE